jgi:hypothetical protein
MCDGEEGCRVASATTYYRTFTLCMRPDSGSIKLLDTPRQKLRRGGGLRKTNSWYKVLSGLLLRRRDFALASIRVFLVRRTGYKTLKIGVERKWELGRKEGIKIAGVTGIRAWKKSDRERGHRTKNILNLEESSQSQRFYRSGSASRVILVRFGRETSTGYTHC